MGDLFGTTFRADDPFFGMLTDDASILRQACLLRLSTERASLWTDPEYGDSLTDLLQDGLTADAFGRIPDRVRAELEKDERIGAVDVKATISGSPGSYGVKLAITVRPLQGPTFPLTIAITNVSVELLTEGTA